MSHDTPRPMRLHLLAAPRLLVDGEVVHLGSRKALALLAVLALDGGATRERLAALLWPEVDPAGGRRNLRRELFRLREFGVPLLDAPDGTLALDTALGVDAVELLRRDRLVEVDGTVLEGLDGLGSPELDAWLQRWRDQIAQQHAGLVEHEAQACEQRGNLAAALALRTRRWAADPCNEAAALQVMRLHADLGDRAAALQAYQRLAECLRDELDVVPSETVRQFAQNLRQTAGHAGSPPAVAAAGPTPLVSLQGDGAGAAQALPPVVPFVARAAAQQRIEAAWARGQRVYLHGAPGAGKTRLASELAAARGPWLRVACEPQDSELPYASVVRVLRALRASAPDVVLPDWVQRELAQLMPELGASLPGASTDDARQRLLAAVGEAWGLLMRDNFSALVLDDWHWGDPASVTLWSRLDDGSGTPAVAWIIAFRSAQLPRAALERQRADLDSQRGVAVALEGMDDAEVLALTHALSGAPGGRLFSQRLRHATEGNPFFLLETLRHLFEQGLLTADAEGWSTPFDEHTQDYAELPVPASVRATVQARVRALGAPLQRVLEIASLGSVDIDAHLLAATSDMDEEAAIAALEHAAAAQLVQETGSGWRFTHDLVRQSLMQGLSAGRRRLLHERLALRLERADAQPALVAAHWEAAQQPARAIRWRVAAAESALRVHALDAALASYAQALADGAQGAVAATIQQGCARVHMRRADHAAADAAFAEAMTAAASDAAAGPDEVLRLQLEQAEYWCTTDRVDAALAVLEALAPELSKATPARRAMALAVRGAGLARVGRYSTAEALMSEAEGLLEGVPESRPQLAELLLNLARSSQWRGDADASGRHARRAVAVYESLGDRVGLVKSLGLLAQFHKALGERDQAVAIGERARALAARCGNVPVQQNAIFNLVRIYIDLGDTDRVTALLDEGEALGPVFESRMMRGNYLAARYYVHFLRGELQAAHAAATRLLDAFRLGTPLLLLGYLHIVCDLFLLEGDTEGARALIAEAQEICDAQRAAGEKVWFLNSQAYYRAQLAVDTGRPQEALALLGEAEDSVELDERFKQAWIGAAAARALGDLADAARRLAIVDIDADPPSDQLAHWLVQRLALAAAEGRRDAAGLARAQALLAERRVPMLLVERLQRAIDAVPR